MRSLQWIAALAVGLISTSAVAADFNVSNITAADYETLVKEFSANFGYSSVNGASSLGGLGGFELGLTGGITKIQGVHDLVKRNSPTTDFEDKAYHAAILGRVGVPYGLTAELMYFPERKFSNLEVGHFGGAAMWTVTDVVWDYLPFALATKIFFSKTDIEYAQTLTEQVTGTPVNATIEFDNTLYGIQALISRKILFFEPYIGLGYLKAKGDLEIKAAGTFNFFNSTFSAAQTNKAVAKPSSAQFLLGTDFQIAFFSLGAEYQRAFGTNSVTGRLSFRF
jgi:hypothetical protein